MLLCLGLLIGGALTGLTLQAAHDPSGAVSAFDPYLFRIAWFTLWQAALSTLLSVAPALLLARALSRHPNFAGRSLALKLFALPLALPAIVAALGILALLGRAGLLAAPISSATGGQWQGIYGLSGILVAHVFFNLPLAARLFLAALEAVPLDHWRLASQLGMRAGSALLVIEWPALRAALPGIAGLVFMLCVTSFTIVLTLGGGPGATTLEVAIYQALRFDFDPARAVALTLLQVAVTAAAIWLLAKIGRQPAEADLTLAGRRYLTVGPVERLANGLVIGAASVFVAAPILAIVLAGLQADLVRLLGEAAVLQAAGTSLLLSALAALLAVVGAATLTVARAALASRRGSAPAPILERLADTGAGFVLVVPPIVIGAGWFMLLRQSGALFAAAPAMVIAVNAAMALPFALRILRPAHDAAAARHERLALSLGIAGWSRWRLIDWPGLKRPIATALAFAMALSLGDLGVIALFGSDAVQTLPYLLLSRMGSYRTEDAAGLGLLLALICFILVLAAERLSRERPL